MTTFTLGTTISGFDFLGNARRGFIVAINVSGGWYAVEYGFGVRAAIRITTARAVNAAE